MPPAAAATRPRSQNDGRGTRFRRDQPRRLEVFAAIAVGVFASASGRLLGDFGPTGTPIAEQLQQWSRERAAAMEGLLARLKRGGTDQAKQPEFAGEWRTERSENLDSFLDLSMGVGYLKRTIAVKASQTQKLYQKGDVIHLEISDRRGTARYILRPDGKTHSSTGFMKLPIKQKAKWARDGSLLVEERYAQHLGGEEHGTKCHGDSCPLIRSRRSLDKASGMMLIEIERTLRNGDVVKTKSYYRAADS